MENDKTLEQFRNEKLEEINSQIDNQILELFKEYNVQENKHKTKKLKKLLQKLTPLMDIKYDLRRISNSH